MATQRANESTDSSPPSTYAEVLRLARKAVEVDQILLFRLHKDDAAESGFRAVYALSQDKTYIAVSHCWTDRTGTGDSIHLRDLAPWSITVSPAKIHFFEYLRASQDSVDPESGVVQHNWYWLDLLCIDQSKSDEELFSRQLGQIPQVFWRSVGTLCLVASKPCDIIRVEISAHSDAGDPDDQYDAICKTIESHHSRCACTPFVDAWFTRVWTRQEFLYSKTVIFLTADVWAPALSEPPSLWNMLPSTYPLPHPVDGIRELAQVLHLWATKAGLPQTTYGPGSISRIIKNLFAKSHALESYPSTAQEVRASPGWFVLNWDMVLNGSIRRTTHARDAILSQMLGLPGFVVPHQVWTLPLEDIAADAARQFRHLIPHAQLVPCVMKGAPSGNPSPQPFCTATILPRLPQSDFSQILESVGTARLLPTHQTTTTEAQCPFVGYHTDWRYQVLGVLDTEYQPLHAAKGLLSCSSVWDAAKESRVTHNMRASLRQLERATQTYLIPNPVQVRTQRESGQEDPSDHLRAAVRHCLERLAARRELSVGIIKSSAVHGGEMYSAREFESKQGDDLHAVLVKLSLPPSHSTEGTRNESTYNSVLFCEAAEIPQEGRLWATGIAGSTGLESLIVGRETENGIIVSASGAQVPPYCSAQDVKITESMKGWILPGEQPRLRPLLKHLTNG